MTEMDQPGHSNRTLQKPGQPPEQLGENLACFMHFDPKELENWKGENTSNQ